MSKPVVIAVDGPAASGKGTFARQLADALGYAYLDTGALYRTLALETLKRGGDPSKIEDILPILDALEGVPVDVIKANPDLRTSEVAEAASKVSGFPEVRAAVRAYQDEFMKNPGKPGVVMDGRDVGTVVCPTAEVKFFVTADAAERARRRFNDLKDKQPGLTQEQVLEDIKQRDERDMDRAHSPLKAAADAYILDNTHLTPAQALEKAIAVVRAKLAPPPANSNKIAAPRRNGTGPRP